MSLSAWEQQILDSIGDVLSGSDPELAVLMATFSELASGEDMPAAEQILPRPYVATWLESCRRRRPRRSGMYRSKSRLGQVLTVRWAVPLLWLLITVTLIATALAISSGASQGQCPRSWLAACPSTAPVHTSRSVTRGAVTRRVGRGAEPSRSAPAQGRDALPARGRGSGPGLVPVDGQ